MSSGLGAGESGAHWSLALEDVLTVILGIVEDEAGEAGLLLVGLDGEANTAAVVLINGMLDESDLGSRVLWLFTNLEQTLINVLSHAEALSVLTSDSMLGIVELSFPGGATESVWMTS